MQKKKYSKVFSQMHECHIWMHVYIYYLGRSHDIFFYELHKYRRRHSTRMHTHPYEHTYANTIHMSTSKRLC
jgi:hypothetical protein